MRGIPLSNSGSPWTSSVAVVVGRVSSRTIFARMLLWSTCCCVLNCEMRYRNRSAYRFSSRRCDMQRWTQEASHVRNMQSGSVVLLMKACLLMTLANAATT
eukprot:14119085-Alexandrium_andersonii.AAC.1